MNIWLASYRGRRDTVSAAFLCVRENEGGEADGDENEGGSAGEIIMSSRRAEAGEIKYSGMAPRAGMVRRTRWGRDATRGRLGLWGLEQDLRQSRSAHCHFHGTPAFPPFPD